MPILQTQGFAALVESSAAAVQGAAAKAIDLSVGSVARALIESVAGVALWLQSLALQIASATRLATSGGADVDSFGADFGFSRLPAYAATGTVTFSRFTATQQGFIPAASASGILPSGQTDWSGGALVQTADGVQQFRVIPDVGQIAYSATLGGYVIPAGTATCAATVQAANTGASGNVAAAAIATLVGALAFVDTVTNGAAFQTGADSETDDAFKTRFSAWVASLGRATPLAVAEAVADLKPGATALVVENQTPSGSQQIGYFYAIVDDGSGSPNATFLAAASAAIDRVRPAGVQFAVIGPTRLVADISASVTSAPGYLHAAVVLAVSQAIHLYVNSLKLGQSLPLSRIAQLAFDASPGVINITGVTLNGSATDLMAGSQTVIRVGAITLT